MSMLAFVPQDTSEVFYFVLFVVMLPILAHGLLHHLHRWRDDLRAWRSSYMGAHC
jgi:hypothetical protein